LKEEKRSESHKENDQDKAELIKEEEVKDAEAEDKSEAEKNNSEIDILRQSFEEKKKEAADYYDQLLRLKADFANYRLRHEKESRSYIEWGKSEILAKQISVLDVLEQAEKSIKMGGKTQDIIVGLEMINKEFLKILSEEGVEEIKLKKFDPAVCDALDYIESDKEEGTILEVYQKGYMIRGKLLRPAKVKVAKKKEEKKEDSNTEGDNHE
jgi:molecular chaperone GrpE